MQAQKPVNIDSLERVTEKMPEDTNRVKNYMELAKLYMRKNFEQTLFYGKKACLLSKKLGFLKGQLNGLNAAGIGTMYTGDNHTAIAYFDSVLSYQGNFPDKKLFAKAGGNKGLALDGLGKYQEAIDCYLKALKAGEETKDTSFMASTYANMSNSFYRLRKSAESEQYAQKAYELHKQIGNIKGMSNALNSIATIKYDAKKYDEAEKMYTELATLREKINDLPGLVNINLNLASLYSSIKDYVKAERSFLKALEYNKVVNNAKAQVQILYDFSTFYRDLKKTGRQMVFLDSARVLAEKMEDLEDLRYIYRDLSQVYESSGDFKTSLKYQRQLQQVTDSVFNIESDSKVSELRTQFETEKKEKEIELLNKETLLKDTVIEKQNSTRNFILLVGGLIFVLAVALLIGYRNKRRSNILLSEQKAEITHQKHLIEEKQKEILDSIYYARRIQRSLLTSQRYISRTLERLKK